MGVAGRKLAEEVRQRCLEAAREGYETASIRGLCHEGAWEIAMGAIRAVDLTDLLSDEKPAADQATSDVRRGSAADPSTPEEKG